MKHLLISRGAHFGSPPLIKEIEIFFFVLSPILRIEPCSKPQISPSYFVRTFSKYNYSRLNCCYVLGAVDVAWLPNMCSQ